MDEWVVDSAISSDLMRELLLFRAIAETPMR